MSLGDIDEPALLPFIIWFLKKTQSPRVLKNLYFSAYKLGHKPSLEPLTTYLLNGDYFIRGATANSLLCLKEILSLKEITEVVLPALDASLIMDDDINIRNIRSQFEKIVNDKIEMQG